MQHTNPNQIPLGLWPWLIVATFSVICSPLRAADAGVSHQLSAVILPETGEIRVEDTVRTARPSRRFEFILNAGLGVRGTDGEIRAIGTSSDGLRTAWQVSMETPASTLKLHYQGIPRFADQTRLGDMPQGIVAPEGVYLDGASAWYPLFDTDLDTVRLEVKLPDGWRAVSNGRYTESPGTSTWTSEQPQDDLYLIAGPYTRHLRRHHDLDLSVWLLDDDPDLAARYLALIGDYIDHYSRLIGAYPYPKFAVVENRWPTGFGMPSFTLLGSQVLRLPFIPYTSLPHEILHNWWGNGVWVDYAKGNWSEGLTAYLADHWMQEREGKGDQYRLKALQGYSNFAAQGQDQPLLAFVGRHSDASQSVGYGKSLMLFHMLRERIGDAAFTAGLQRLWQERRFTRVGFVDAFSTIGATDPEATRQLLPWLDRTGAPQIRLRDPHVAAEDGQWRLSFTIEQAQAQPFALRLPVLVTLDGEATARRLPVAIDGRSQQVSWRFERRPLRLDVDPEYDVLRLLDATEQPPALNRLFGGREVWLVIPSAAPQPMREAWNALAEAWRARYPGMRLIEDSAAADLGDDAERLLLGWDNAALGGARTAFDRDQQRLEPEALRVDDQRYPATTDNVVLVATAPDGTTTGFIGATSPDAVAALARKLPHYGSYGRLVFDATGNNRRRDTLTATHSRLSHQFGDTAVALHAPPRTVLGATGDR